MTASKKTIQNKNTKVNFKLDFVVHQLFCLALLFTASNSVNAQQMPQYSQYMKNQYLINPAAAGIYNYVDIIAGGRLQWLGFSDAPSTMYFYASSDLKGRKSKYNPSLRVNYGATYNPVAVYKAELKHALGGSLIVDRYGAFQYIKGSVTYAVHMPVSDKMSFSFGANVGLSNRSFIKSRAQTLNNYTGVGVDATYDAYASQRNLNILDVGAGLYLYSSNLFVGIAADQLTKDFVKLGSNGVNIDPRMHFNFVAGYKFKVSSKMTLTPSILAKYVKPSPFSIEGSLMLEWNNRVWYGLSYRYQDAVIAFVGMNITNKLKFGYSFDFSTSQFNKHSFGGHELNIGLML